MNTRACTQETLRSVLDVVLHDKMRSGTSAFIFALPHLTHTVDSVNHALPGYPRLRFNQGCMQGGSLSFTVKQLAGRLTEKPLLPLSSSAGQDGFEGALCFPTHSPADKGKHARVDALLASHSSWHPTLQTCAFVCGLWHRHQCSVGGHQCSAWALTQHIVIVSVAQAGHLPSGCSGAPVLCMGIDSAHGHCLSGTGWPFAGAQVHECSIWPN
eukprot:1161635-Pelagomonas_calceolata.AAC.7